MPAPTPTQPLRPTAKAAGLISLRQVVAELESEGVWPLTPRSARPSLHEGWVEFITRHNWQWFCTFTFREEVHPEKADKLFRLWCALLDESILGRYWHRKNKRYMRVQWVRGLEWQKRGVLHYHALLRNIAPYRDGSTDRLFWAEEWNRLAGIARIYPVDDVAGAAGYISKYCAKGGEVDFCAALSPQVRLFNGS